MYQWVPGKGEGFPEDFVPFLVSAARGKGGVNVVVLLVVVVVVVVVVVAAGQRCTRSGAEVLWQTDQQLAKLLQWHAGDATDTVAVLLIFAGV